MNRKNILSGLAALTLAGCASPQPYNAPYTGQPGYQTPKQQSLMDAIFDEAESLRKAVLSGISGPQINQNIIVNNNFQNGLQNTMTNVYGTPTLNGWPNWQYTVSPVFGRTLMVAGTNSVDLNGDLELQPYEMKGINNTFPINSKISFGCDFQYPAREIYIDVIRDKKVLDTMPFNLNNAYKNFSFNSELNLPEPMEVLIVVRGKLLPPDGLKKPKKGSIFTSVDKNGNTVSWDRYNYLYETQHVIGVLPLHFK